MSQDKYECLATIGDCECGQYDRHMEIAAFLAHGTMCIALDSRAGTRGTCSWIFLGKCYKIKPQ